MDPKIILLVDDDKDDRDILQETILAIDKTAEIYSLPNGHKALEYLNNVKCKTPSLIVLDYNMPLITGADLLVKIFANEEYRAIPIVMLSTSNAERHVEQCLRNGAKEYFVKPTDYNELEKLANKLLEIAS